MRTTLITTLFCLLAIPITRGQTSQPAAAGNTGLSVAATDAFNAGRYAVALPMLQKLSDQYQNNPDQLAPVQEEIRVCQKQIAIAANAVAVAPPAPGAGDPTMNADTRTPHPAPGAGQTVEMTIKELGNFDYDADKGGNIPADVKALSGANLKLRGFMIPMDQADSITQFALVPSLFACCFGQPPQIQHTIIVNCPKGKAVGYFPDEISVEGKLNVDEKKEDGFIVSIFELECSSVKPVAK
jgi:hypothetical protein